MAQDSNKNGHGGSRPNSGRKKGASAIIMERARTYALQQYEQELEPIIKASISLAKGIYVEETDEETGERIRIYQKAPDVNALKHALDQLIGKPTETINQNHSGEIGLAELLGTNPLDNAPE